MADDRMQECTAKQKAGILISNAQIANCADQAMTKAFSDARFPYMDLVLSYNMDRNFWAKRLDDRVTNPTEVRNAMLASMNRLLIETKRRAAGQH